MSTRLRSRSVSASTSLRGGSFRSKSGLFTIARISPVAGSIASTRTALASLACSASRAACSQKLWMEASIVSVTLPPFTAAMYSLWP